MIYTINLLDKNPPFKYILRAIWAGVHRREPFMVKWLHPKHVRGSTPRKNPGRVGWRVRTQIWWNPCVKTNDWCCDGCGIFFSWFACALLIDVKNEGYWRWKHLHRDFISERRPASVKELRGLPDRHPWNPEQYHDLYIKWWLHRVHEVNLLWPESLQEGTWLPRLPEDIGGGYCTLIRARK